MTSVLGLDISSTQLNSCLLEPGKPPVLSDVKMAGKTVIDRVRAIPEALMRLMAFQADPDWIVIEIPKGDRVRTMVALSRVVGVITACADPHIQIAWRTASEWRHDLGAKNTKTAGHEAVRLILDPKWGYGTAAQLDEHELDACGIALAWQRILEAQAC